MNEALEKIVVRALSNEMQRIRLQVPNSKWFLFGSVTSTRRPVGDVDFLVVCKNAADCVTIRSELDTICAQFPVHLLIMSESEESEVNFIKDQRAIEIT